MSFGYFSESITLYTVQATTEYATRVVENAVKGEILTIMEAGSLMNTTKDSNGNVVYSSIDTYKVNKIRNVASRKVIDAIELIEAHEDLRKIELPIGYFFSRNIFLSNGVKVPIELYVAGSHSVEVVASAEAFGINSSIVEVFLQIKISVQVTIPFQAKDIEVISTIPLSIEIINSKVPDYYYNGVTPIPTS